MLGKPRYGRSDHVHLAATSISYDRLQTGDARTAGDGGYLTIGVDGSEVATVTYAVPIETSPPVGAGVHVVTDDSQPATERTTGTRAPYEVADLDSDLHHAHSHGVHSGLGAATTVTALLAPSDVDTDNQPAMLHHRTLGQQRHGLPVRSGAAATGSSYDALAAASAPTNPARRGLQRVDTFC